MARQWYNNRITRKPGMRYNPSIQNKFAKIYRPWFVFVAVACLILGVAHVGVSAALKSEDSNLRIELFQIWVSVPVLVYGLFALMNAVGCTNRKFTVLFIILSFAVLVVTLAGAFGAGFYFWKDGWRRAKISFSNDRCRTYNNHGCKCSDTTLPVQFDDCDNVEKMIDMILAEIALSAISIVVSIVGLFVAFMSICCSPWVYMENYDKEYDPDMGNKIPQSINGNINRGYVDRSPHFHY